MKRILTRHPLACVGEEDATTDVFAIVDNAVRSVEQWAADRGAQIRDAFGLQADTLRPAGMIGPDEMSADAWNWSKIDTLAPEARESFTGFLEDAQAVARSHGTELIIWDAARSLERQLSLYKQGRTTPGGKVTYAIASNHLWGMAIDLIFRSPRGQPLSKGPPGSRKYPGWYFREVLPLAAQHGLQSLYLAKGIDPPHIEFIEGQGERVASAVTQIQHDFPGLA